MVDDYFRYVLKPLAQGGQSQYVHINDSLHLKRGAGPGIRISNVSAGCKMKLLKYSHEHAKLALLFESLLGERSSAIHVNIQELDML